MHMLAHGKNSFPNYDKFWNYKKVKKVFKRRNQNIDKSGPDDFSAPVQLPMPQNGDLQTPSQIMDRLLEADEKDES